MSDEQINALRKRPKADFHDVTMAQDWVISLGEALNREEFGVVVRDYINDWSVYYLLGANNEVYLLAMHT